jgi:hypothetical protein
VTESEALGADAQAAGKSREQEYEELARAIGLPQHAPSWRRFVIFACLAVASGLFAVLLQLWVHEQTKGLSGLGSVNYLGWEILVFCAAMVTLPLVVGCLVFPWLRMSEGRKEREWKRKLGEIVAKDPQFMPFYEDWVKRYT